MFFLTGKKAAVGLALASTLALGGCYDDGYGYGGISAGYGGGGGYYDDGYYGGGYGYPSYGWYDNFYYPGNGYYVYDRGGQRHRWRDSDRRYWEARRGGQGRPGGGQWNGRPDRPGNGQGSGRPDRPGNGQWNGRPDRPDGGDWAGRPDRGPRPDGTVQPDRGPRPDRGDRAERQRANRGQGVWGAVPQSVRPQASTPRPDRASGDFQRGQRGGRQRGNPQ